MPLPTDEDLVDEVSGEGHPPGSALHLELVTAKKVERCQEARGVNDCGACPHFAWCGVVKAHLTNLKYGELAKHRRLAEGSRL